MGEGKAFILKVKYLLIYIELNYDEIKVSKKLNF